MLKNTSDFKDEQNSSGGFAAMMSYPGSGWGWDSGVGGSRVWVQRSAWMGDGFGGERKKSSREAEGVLSGRPGLTAGLY